MFLLLESKYSPLGIFSSKEEVEKAIQSLTTVQKEKTDPSLVAEFEIYRKETIEADTKHAQERLDEALKEKNDIKIAMKDITYEPLKYHADDMFAMKKRNVELRYKYLAEAKAGPTFDDFYAVKYEIQYEAERLSYQEIEVNKLWYLYSNYGRD
jgi:hypothetical protein